MRRWLVPLSICLGLHLFSVLPAWADGTQYSPTCPSIAWNANTEQDLAGYRLYDRVSLVATPTLRATFGIQITTVTCASLGLNAGQHYFSLRSFDTSSNESGPSTEIPFVIVVSNQVSDLRVTVVNATDITLAFTEVEDGQGAPANYDIRIKSPTMDNWGSAASVTSGTCSTPVAGTTIGATKTCTATGLSVTTPYEFQLIPFRGTLNVDAVFGPLSNITGATTGGSVPTPTNRVTQISDGFPGSDGPLTAPWQGGYNAFGGQPTTDLVIASNRLRAANTTSDAVMTHTTSLPNDQWCQFTIKTLTGGGLMGPRCELRMGPPGAKNGYSFAAIAGLGGFTTWISVWIGGSHTILMSEAATTWAANDVLRAEVIGGQLSLYRNDVLLLEVADATYGSGLGGITMYSSVAVADSELDDVSFGSFEVASADPCGCDQH